MMGLCRHCKGTGEEPDQIKLECVSCQRPVVFRYSSTRELLDMAEKVLCAECKRNEP